LPKVVVVVGGNWGVTEVGLLSGKGAGQEGEGGRSGPARARAKGRERNPLTAAPAPHRHPPLGFPFFYCPFSLFPNPYLPGLDIWV
jgi:hypothetical protein